MFRAKRDGILQSDAAGGDNEGGEGGACVAWTVFIPHHGSNDISRSLANPYAGVAERNALARKGVEHLVAQRDLSIAHLHPMHRENIQENMVDVSVSLFWRGDI